MIQKEDATNGGLGLPSVRAPQRRNVAELRQAHSRSGSEIASRGSDRIGAAEDSGTIVPKDRGVGGEKSAAREALERLMKIVETLADSGTSEPSSLQSWKPRTGAGSKKPFPDDPSKSVSQPPAVPAETRALERASLYEKATGWHVRTHLVWGLVIAVSSAFAFYVGHTSQRENSVSGRPQPEALARPPISETEREEVRSRLDRAFALVHAGDTEGGWQEIHGIAERHPDVPSLAYAEALVAAQAQRFPEAVANIELSLSRRERIAESLALQAAVAAMSSELSPSKHEELLRQAVDADPMNPSPLIELATFHIARGDNERAESLINSAKTRLLPVDSHAVVDASLAILRLKRAPSEGLPSDIRITGKTEEDFPNAYAAMRRGDFQTAATILDGARRSVSPEVFDYLLNASPIREFALEPQITRFY